MHFQVDLGIKEYLKGISGLPDDDIFISSTAFAMRNRLQRTGLQQLKLPYLSFRSKPSAIRRPDSTFIMNWRNTHGRWIEDMVNPNSSQTGNETGDRVLVYPYFCSYEALFVANRYVEAANLHSLFYEKNFDDQLVPHNYIINDTTYTFDASLEFTSLELNPDWNESDELQRGKISTVSLDFDIHAFTFKGLKVSKLEEIQMEIFYNGQKDEEPKDGDIDGTPDRVFNFP